MISVRSHAETQAVAASYARVSAAGIKHEQVWTQTEEEKEI